MMIIPIEYKLVLDSFEMDKLVYILKKTADKSAAVVGDDARYLIERLKNQGVPIST